MYSYENRIKQRKNHTTAKHLRNTDSYRKEIGLTEDSYSESGTNRLTKMKRSTYELSNQI